MMFLINELRAMLILPKQLSSQKKNSFKIAIITNFKRFIDRHTSLLYLEVTASKVYILCLTDMLYKGNI